MILQVVHLIFKKKKKKKEADSFFWVERKKSSKCSVQLLLLWHFVHVHVTNSTFRGGENVAFMSVYGIYFRRQRRGGFGSC